MPDPISSSRSQSSSIDPDPSLDEAGQVCRSAPPNSSQPEPTTSSAPSSVPTLVAAVPPPPTKLPPATTSAAPSQAQNNAQRTTERVGVAPYAECGVTAAGDAVYAGAAALKGRDPKTGIEVEVFSASGQLGMQAEAQAAMARIGVSGKNGSATVDVLTARGNFGVHNDDGSTGLNGGALATAVGFEGTYSKGPESATFGLALGVGQAYSIGLRDADGNGKHELCVKQSFGILTAGFCVEWPW